MCRSIVFLSQDIPKDSMPKCVEPMTGTSLGCISYSRRGSTQPALNHCSKDIANDFPCVSVAWDRNMFVIFFSATLLYVLITWRYLKGNVAQKVCMYFLKNPCLDSTNLMCNFKKNYVYIWEIRYVIPRLSWLLCDSYTCSIFAPYLVLMHGTFHVQSW